MSAYFPSHSDIQSCVSLDVYQEEKVVKMRKSDDFKTLIMASISGIIILDFVKDCRRKN